MVYNKFVIEYQILFKYIESQYKYLILYYLTLLSLNRFQDNTGFSYSKNYFF